MTKRIVIMIAGGGFSSQLGSLIDQLSNNLELFYFVPDNCSAAVPRLPKGRCFKTPALSQSFSTGLEPSPKLWWRLFKLHRANLKEINPQLVISLGSTEALPVSLAARSLGIRVIFIESIARVTDLSKTGKLIYWLCLANRFYVQWPRLAKQYPRACYRGIVHDLRNRGLNSV